MIQSRLAHALARCMRPVPPQCVLAGALLLGAAWTPAALAAPGVSGARESPSAVAAPTSETGDAVDARLREVISRAQATPEPPANAATTGGEAVAGSSVPPGAAASWWGRPGVVHEVSSRASELVVNALSFLGVRYRYGGDHAAKGFDCSGLVQRVYQETLGLVLPHNAAQQSREGEKIAENELRPGDLVFFNTLRRAFSHVGIYIGNGQFVHAPRPGQRVQIANLDSPYWARRFDGARRLITHATEPLMPSAEAASPEPGATGADAGARSATRPAAALPLSNAIPAGASPETTALMAGALLPRPTPESGAR